MIKNYKIYEQTNNLNFWDWNNDLNDMTFLKTLLLNNDKNIQEIFRDNSNNFLDIPVYYRSSFMISSLEKINTVFFLGCFSRFESPLLNLHFRKNINKKKIEFFAINSFNNYTYPVNLIGNSNKSSINLLYGRSFKTLFLFKNNKNKGFLKSHDSYNKQHSEKLYNNILMKALFMNASKDNFFLILNYNVTLLSAKEFFMNSFSKNIQNHQQIAIANFNINKLNLINMSTNKNLLTLLKNTSLKTSLVEINNYTSHDNLENLSFLEQISTQYKSNWMNKSFLKMIPIKTLVEKTSFLMNIEGKLNKVSYANNFFNLNVQALSFELKKKSFKNTLISNWYGLVMSNYYLEAIYCYDFGYPDDSVNLNYYFIVKELNKYYFYLETKKSKDILMPYFYKSFGSFFDLYQTYKNNRFYSFDILSYLPKFSSRKISFFTYKNNINDFYKTDNITKNSVNMGYLLLYNRYKDFFPVFN